MSNSSENNQTNQFEKKIAALEAEIVELRRKNDLQDQVINLNQDSIFVKDANLNWIFANDAALSFYSKKIRDKLIGTNPAEHFPPEQVAKFEESDHIALTTGIYEKKETVLLDDGREIQAQITKKRFIGEDGAPYLLCISRDITDREDLIVELKRSNADLDNFAYVASHDLRAPLNAIKTMVAWVREDCEDILPLESKDNLALVMNRVERMEKLLMDLLEYSRMGREKQLPVRFNIRKKVLELLNLVDLPMGFGIRCDDVEVTLPETPFNVVMVNLIGNAIKHHDSANANISISVKTTKRYTVITVADNGPGVPDEYKQKVFELFTTLKPRDELEGSGMGLSVVKKLVEQYQGKIEVADNSPRGTKFIISWPQFK
ncbi:sensor histidine kinase [Glaciecola sp. 1036]|uniref:sensor histidine kinase n=1 Tax=Alteromonadaceae TaxID=72275 RepID=UPI003D074962